MKRFFKAGKTDRYVDNKKSNLPSILYFLSVVFTIVLSWVVFACLWLAVSKTRLVLNEHFGGHGENMKHLKTKNYGNLTIVNVNDRLRIEMNSKQNITSKCVRGVHNFKSALLLAIQTHNSLVSNHQSINTDCFDSFILVILQIFVAFVLQGVLCGVLFWSRISIWPDRLFKFDDKILIEEIKQFNSKKIFILHFKVEKTSMEVMSNVNITARLHWLNNTKREEDKVRFLNDYDDEVGIFYSQQESSTELLNASQENNQPMNLELCYDKLGAQTNTFHLFPWPLVLFHQIDLKSPLWKDRKNILKKNTKSEFKIELTISGFKGSLADSFSVTSTYHSDDVTYLDEFISHVIFSRNLDTNEKFNFNHI